jgi:tetratricopeptide (TPR) repeat protein
MEHMAAGRTGDAMKSFSAALQLDRNHLPSLLQMADILSVNSRPFQAYGVLKHAVEIAPASAEALALRGRVFFQLKKVFEARNDLLRARELKPKLPEPLFLLGIIETELGRLPDARRNLETFLPYANEKETLRAKEMLAQVLLQMQDSDAAIKLLQELTQKIPEREDLQQKIAGTLLETGRYEEAEQAYRALLAKKPRDRELLLKVYDASYQRGAYEQSIATMQQLAQREPNSCEPLLNLVRAYRRVNQFDKAQQQAEKCLALVPGHASAHYLLGVLRYGAGNLNSAKNELEKSLRSNPDFGETYYWLGTIENRLGNKAAALPHLEKAVELDPGHVGARYTLARALQAQGRTEEAKAQMEEFQRLKKRDAWVSQGTETSAAELSAGSAGYPSAAKRVQDWITFAEYLMGQEKPRDALLLLEAAQRLEPDNGKLYSLSAAALTTVGEIDRALEAYARAEQLQADGEIFLGRGKIYFRLGKQEEALADFNRAASADLPATRASEAHLLLGSVLNKKKLYGEAAAELRLAFALNPQDTATKGMLAWTLLKTDKVEESVALCRAILKDSPDDASTLLVLAQGLIEQKNLSEVSRLINRAATTLGENGQVLLTWGKLYIAQGLKSTAVDYLTRAGQVDPSQVEPFHLLGTYLQEQGRTSEAAVAFEKATIVDPQHAPSWLALGKIYLNANRAQAAVGHLQKAAEASSNDSEIQYQLATALAQAGQIAPARLAARKARTLGHPQAQALLQSLQGRSGN